MAATFRLSAALLVLAAPALAASVHHHGRHHARPAPSSGQIQPIAPAAQNAGPATSPAPVPNEAMNAPIDREATTTKVAPSVFQLHYPPQGEGYVTGSSPQAMDDRNAAKATGVEMKVPLPQ